MGGMNKDNCFKDKVKCETCRCWLDEMDSYKVKTIWGTEHYCLAHKKPYSRVILPGTYGLANDEPIRYFGEVEMTEDGVPVKQEKKNG